MVKSWGAGGGAGGVDEELGAGEGAGGVDKELWGGRTAGGVNEEWRWCWRLDGGAWDG